jgi:hypothetical protein
MSGINDCPNCGVYIQEMDNIRSERDILLADREPGKFRNMLDRLLSLEDERDRLRYALEWYADIENYRYPSGREMCEDKCYAAKPIDADDGERARNALGV